MVAVRFKQYVVGFLKEHKSDRIVFIRKAKPDWQAGKLNGVGGKVEDDEFPITAMRREWREETKTPGPSSWRQFAIIEGGTPKTAVYRVYFFAAECDVLPTFEYKNDVGEEIVTAGLDIVGNPHVAMIDNLRWLLPLAFLDPAVPVVFATQRN